MKKTSPKDKIIHFSFSPYTQQALPPPLPPNPHIPPSPPNDTNKRIRRRKNALFSSSFKSFVELWVGGDVKGGRGLVHMLFAPALRFARSSPTTVCLSPLRR